MDTALSAPEFIRTDSQNPGFQALVVLLDEYLAFLDGDEHEFYAQFNKTAHLKNVVVGYIHNKAVATGAFREIDLGPGIVEIKRMYTVPEYRGRGIALGILKELETWALELGYHTFLLETGKRQPEAISLYQKAGYVFTENYGQYIDVGNSVCMKKVVPGKSRE